MIGAALPLGAAFVWWQRRQDARGGAQLVPVGLLQSRNFLVGMAMAALLFSGIPGFFLVLAIYLQTGFGLTPLQSGLTTLPFSLGVLTVSLLSARFGIRWGRRRITAGGLMLATAMVWLRFAALGTGDAVTWSHFAPALLLGGLGLGTAVGPLFQTILASVPARDAGSGSGALQSFQQVGGAFGVAIMGEIFFSGLAGPRSADGAASHDAFNAAFTHAMLYNTAAFVAVALLVRLLPKPGSIERPEGLGAAGAAEVG
jgi:MFS family permease